MVVAALFIAANVVVSGALTTEVAAAVRVSGARAASPVGSNALCAAADVSAYALLIIPVAVGVTAVPVALVPVAAGWVWGDAGPVAVAACCRRGFARCFTTAGGAAKSGAVPLRAAEPVGIAAAGLPAAFCGSGVAVFGATNALYAVQPCLARVVLARATAATEVNTSAVNNNLPFSAAELPVSLKPVTANAAASAALCVVAAATAALPAVVAVR